jgi:glycosyltransferase involved in cell wall biosynthesis
MNFFKKSTKFSVLLPVYKNDSLDSFKIAVESVYKSQSVKPSKVVIVRDGPVKDDVQKFLDKLKKKSVYKIIELKKNIGLSGALNIGIKNIDTEIIARADADDICLSDRFKFQLKYIQKYDIIGTFMQEFSQKKSGKILTLPVVPNKKYASLQTPIWHPTVMYKKSVLKKVGGYEDIYLFEDYLLWSKLFMKGAKFYNIDKVLVKHRMDDSLFKRRSGLKLFLSEIHLQNKFLQIKFINKNQYFRNIIIRGLYRFFPVKLKLFFNKISIKKKLFG